MIERWINCPEHPRYMVSNLGNVYDKFRDTTLAQSSDRAGYLRVKIHTTSGRMTASVHRLVAGSFYDGDIEDFEINHIDGNKKNNFIGNLELCDRSHNMIHAFRNGLAKPMHPTQRIMIVETGEVFESTGQIDRYLNASSGSVSKTLRGLQPTCRGYTFVRLP